MLRNRKIRKYERKLLPSLVKRYGIQPTYNARQVRATVYQCDFAPQHLPLGYMLFLEPSECKKVLSNEFPDLSINKYREDISEKLANKQLTIHLKSPLFSE